MNITSTTYFNIESFAYRFIPFSDSTEIIFTNTITPFKEEREHKFYKPKMHAGKQTLYLRVTKTGRLMLHRKK
jgi:hypothetical protein